MVDEESPVEMEVGSVLYRKRLVMLVLGFREEETIVMIGGGVWSSFFFRDCGGSGLGGGDSVKAFLLSVKVFLPSLVFRYYWQQDSLCWLTTHPLG